MVVVLQLWWLLLLHLLWWWRLLEVSKVFSTVPTNTDSSKGSSTRFFVTLLDYFDSLHIMTRPNSLVLLLALANFSKLSTSNCEG